MSFDHCHRQSCFLNLKLILGIAILTSTSVVIAQEPTTQDVGPEPISAPAGNGSSNNEESLRPEVDEPAEDEPKKDESRAKSVTQLRSIFGFGGTSIERLENDGDGPSGEWTLAPEPVRFGAALQGYKLINPYFGAGAQIPIFYRGYNNDFFLDAAALFRLRKAVEGRGREIVEIYFQFGGGITVYAPSATNTGNHSAVEEDLMVMIGWNLGFAGGVLVNLHKSFGIFADFGWHIRKAYTRLDDIGALMTIMRREPITSVGVSFNIY